MSALGKRTSSAAPAQKKMKKGRIERVNDLKRDAIKALTDWRCKALEEGTDDQVQNACLSYFGSDEEMEKYFDGIDDWQLEEALRIGAFALKPRGFKWKAKWIPDAAFPTTDAVWDDIDVADWITLRGRLAILLSDKNEEWQ